MSFPPTYFPSPLSTSHLPPTPYGVHSPMGAMSPVLVRKPSSHTVTFDVAESPPYPPYPPYPFFPTPGFQNLAEPYNLQYDPTMFEGTIFTGETQPTELNAQAISAGSALAGDFLVDAHETSDTNLVKNTGMEPSRSERDLSLETALGNIEERKNGTEREKPTSQETPEMGGTKRSETDEAPLKDDFKAVEDAETTAGKKKSRKETVKKKKVPLKTSGSPGANGNVKSSKGNTIAAPEELQPQVQQDGAPDNALSLYFSR